MEPPRRRQPGAGVQIPSPALQDFRDFLLVDQQLKERTVRGHIYHIRRFLKSVQKDPRTVTREDLREYLKGLQGAAAYTYANHIKSLRVFFRDYLERPGVVSSFKFPPRSSRIVRVISKEDLRAFYRELQEPMARCMVLMYATTGLRRDELLNLKRRNIDPGMRMIIPEKNGSRTKRTYVTFYNEEAAEILEKLLPEDPEAGIFTYGRDYLQWRSMKIRERTGIKITPKMLREWFCCEMGKLGVPDRYVDAFCGRVPKSVLAKHYTEYSPENLKEIYDKAGIRVLSA